MKTEKASGIVAVLNGRTEKEKSVHIPERERE